MATALCRRLQGGVFRTAIFSSFTRWTGACIPDKLRRVNVQPASYFKKVDGDLQEINKPSVYSTRSNDLEKGQPEDNYKWQYPKRDEDATVQPRIQRRTLPLYTWEPPSERYEKMSYSSFMDPRRFQQSRLEYKSLCYNPEATTDISMEEVETLLQKVACNDDLASAEISDFLEKLSHLPKDHIEWLKSNEQFTKLCNDSIKTLQLFTHGELIRILGAFVRLKIHTNHPILTAYEKECRRRVHCLSTDELLLVADIWRCLLFRVPTFLDIMYGCMDLRCMDLNLAQAMQLIYIIGEGRCAPKELMEKLQAVVLKNLESINLEEIGMICLGFFKSGHRLSKCLMKKFGDVIIENIDYISNYSLVNVLKMFRFTRVNHIDFFKQIGQVAQNRIHNMGIQGIMHITLSFASMHILDEGLLNTVASVIPDRLSHCRSKDIAKLLWSFGTLAYSPPNADVFYSALIDEIYRNLREFKRFPEHFLTCLMALAFCQRFPLDLIRVALSKDFILQSVKISMFELKKDFFTIAGSVEIECPEYTGETISPQLRQEVTEMLVNLSTQSIYKSEMELEAASALKILLGGPEFVKHHMILPHTRSKDLEIHFDINNKPIPLNANIVEVKQPKKKAIGVQSTNALLGQLLNKNLNQTSKETHHRPKTSSKTKNTVEITEDVLSQLIMGRKLKKLASSTEVTKLAVQVTNHNHYCYGQKRLLGLHEMKRRQLQKLGYGVVDLPYWEWCPLMKGSESEKLSYLRCKVFGSLDHAGDG